MKITFCRYFLAFSLLNLSVVNSFCQTTVTAKFPMTTGQVVPPIMNATGAAGEVILSLTGQGNALNGSFTNLAIDYIFTNLTGSAIKAFLRAPAPPGANTNVIRSFLLQPTPTNYGVLSYTTTLNSQEFDALTNGLMYADMATFANQSGEIRGQLGLASAFIFPGLPAGSNLTGISFDKVVPRTGKKISFKTSKGRGFSVKGVIQTEPGNTNDFADLLIQAALAYPGSNGLTNTPLVTLEKKATNPKSAIFKKKGYVFRFKTQKDPAQRVGVGAPTIEKGTQLGLILAASNKGAVLIRTNSIVAGNIK